MWEKIIADLLEYHRGKLIGVLLGLVASILFITFGFWRALLVFVLIGIGYYIGKRLDENKSFDTWINKLFKK